MHIFGWLVTKSASPWTVVHQAPLSMGLSSQEYWSGLPFPTPGNLANPGIKLTSPSLAGGFLVILGILGIFWHSGVSGKRLRSVVLFKTALGKSKATQLFKHCCCSKFYDTECLFSSRWWCRHSDRFASRRRETNIWVIPRKSWESEVFFCLVLFVCFWSMPLMFLPKWKNSTIKRTT